MARTVDLLSLAIAMTFLNATAARETETAHAYTEPVLSAADRDHWSFYPRHTVEIPQSQSSPWCINPVDQFVAEKLEASGLKPQPSASRQTLMRRVTLNLTGLLASPDEVSAFVQDDSPTAYNDLVDRLLASPAHGEHWAQHWLDLARFAETDGFEHDRIRPEAWKYRDWVIDAINANMPDDRFVRMQIAGDLLEADNAAVHVATHFCVAGPDMTDINSQEERRHTLLNEITATVGEVILGLQVGCAECHDHKYDPISQADFYRLRAVFEPAIRVVKDVSVASLSETLPYQATSHVMIRGDFRRPGPRIQPGILRLFVGDSTRKEAALAAFRDNPRVALAEWLTGPNNPLTARVIVNRLWQQHFGTGLTDTPSDFGVMGQQPANHELLEWLANWFVEHNWNVKEFHRLIVTGATYRQQSRLAADASEADKANWHRSLHVDPDARLLSRIPRQRLSGEVIRDVMLAVSGSLNRKLGGPGIRPPLPTELRATLLKDQWEATKDPAEHNRRSIYIFARRNLRFPIFELFDRPAANDSCPTRFPSTRTSGAVPVEFRIHPEVFQQTCKHHSAFWPQQKTHTSRRHFSGFSIAIPRQKKETPCQRFCTTQPTVPA